MRCEMARPFPFPWMPPHPTVIALGKKKKSGFTMRGGFVVESDCFVVQLMTRMRQHVCTSRVLHPKKHRNQTLPSQA